MSRLIIGVGHQKNVGKDTFVNYCFDILRSERRKLKIVRRGFASKLYEFLHSTYSWAGFKDKAFYDLHPEAKNEVLLNGKTPRQMLIDVGTPVLRAYDNDIWINACLKSMDFDILFCTDLRFPNEFEAVESEGGILVRVTRRDLPTPTDVADTALNAWEHKWHHHFENDGTHHNLYEKADSFIREVVLERI